MKKYFPSHTLVVAVPLTLLSGAVSAGVVGFLGNFDAVNTTGQEAHGFEIELEGLHASDITDTFGGLGRGFPTTVERYGAPVITEYATGVRIDYMSSYDAVKGWAVGTPVAPAGFTTGGESCWSGGGLGYGPGTPCDHFGVGTARNPTKTTYSWLLGSSPGTLTNGVVSLPAPVYQVIPQQPPAPNLPPPPPVVIAQVEAPKPENNTEFGDAVWVKVYTTELDHAVRLEDLVGDNNAIKQARSHTEVEWQLLQFDSGKSAAPQPGNGMLELGLAQPVGANAESIIRRYEYYQFAGKGYDPGTHEALLFGNDSNPGAGDVGNFIGAQNGAVNLLGNPAPVPEPEAWAMMLSGIGLMGFMSFRRNQK